LRAKAIATTNGLIYVKLAAFAACHRASMAYAARRSDKPAASAARGSGQIVCNVRGCRPIKKGMSRRNRRRVQRRSLQLANAAGSSGDPLLASRAAGR
jgi:hypothetical protein